MKHKTAELTGWLLDAAVAKADGVETCREFGCTWLALVPGVARQSYAPSTDWTVGGLIIDRENISVGRESIEEPWRAALGNGASMAVFYGYGPDAGQHDGPTPLIAAMRAYVASKLGDEVELP